jgi:uncharacterized protein YdaU (DUF1376 family)
MGTGAQLAMLPFFVRDYIAATRHLSLAERGAYTDLLFLSWEMGPLPADPARLARLVGCGADEFALIWPGIREKFSETPGGLVNARLEEHRAESRRRSQTARQKAEKRWHAEGPGLFDNAAASATAHAAADATAHAGGSDSAYAQGMLPSPSPSPSPEPSPNTDIRPNGRTARNRPGYHSREFHGGFVAMYHEVLPSLPRVKIWGEDRRQLLIAAIVLALGIDRPADTLEWWRRFFESVAASDFLMGRKGDFLIPGIDWLLKNTRAKPIFTRIIEGGYQNGHGNGGHHAR